MNYQHLQYFKEVARGKSYQAAADKLFVTQPTLSRAISGLEKELDVDLFEKVGRNAKLTPYGIAFLAHVESALEALDQGIVETQDMKENVSKTLSIASIYGYSYYYLPTIVKEFVAIYPDVKFQLTQMPTQLVLDQVSLGNVDLGIHLESDCMQEKTDLEYYLIQDIDIVIVVPEKHPLAERKSCLLSEIAAGPLISFNSTSGLLYKTIKMFQEVGLRYTSNLIVGGDQSLLNLVRGNMGAACVLRNVGERADGVSTLEIEDDVDHKVQVFAAICKKRHQARNVFAFLNFLKTNADLKRII
jgi:DNA-binding transcriptional LysR family regulator